MNAYVVEVSEPKVYTYGHSREDLVEAVNWWLWFRRANPLERFHEHDHTPVGSLVDVACDSKEDAEWLANTMVGRGRFPKTAVRVKRAAGGTS